MKKISLLMLAVVVTLSGCMKQQLNDIRGRLTDLEEWQNSVNGSIASLQRLVEALEAKDFVTSVTPLADGTGYVINFQNSGAVTIRHGEKGDTPIIGSKQDTDGKYYWTVGGVWLLNGTAKVPVTGEAPQVKINSTSGEWEVSTDGGATWTSTNVKAQGDAIFAEDGIDNSNADYVELTLADGKTIIRLPKYKAFKIGTDSGNEAITINSTTTNIALSLPAGFKSTDYTAIMAQVISCQGTVTDIVTRTTATLWGVTVNKPTFTADGTYNNDASITVTSPADIDEGGTAMLEVTIVGNDGSKTVATRALVRYHQVFAAGHETVNGKEVAKLWIGGRSVSLTDGKNDAYALSLQHLDGNIYVAGYDNNGSCDVAKLWKYDISGQKVETIALTDETTYSNASSLIISGSYIYVAGYENKGSEIVAKLWRYSISGGNTESIALTDETTRSNARSLILSDADIYVAGYAVSGSNRVATLWKCDFSGGKPEAIALSEGVIDAEALSLHISGNDIYIAGNENNDPNVVAKLWKYNVVSRVKESTSLSDGKTYANAVSVQAEDDKIYVLGNESNGATRVATLWICDLGGKPEKIALSEGENDAEACSLLVSGNDIYAAGYEEYCSKLWRYNIVNRTNKIIMLSDGTNAAYAVSVIIL